MCVNINLTTITRPMIPGNTNHDESCLHPRILEHVSKQTTDVYARANSKVKREALEKVYVDLMSDRVIDREWKWDKNLHDWLREFNCEDIYAKLK